MLAAVSASSTAAERQVLVLSLLFDGVTGGWQAGLPQGVGVYGWADGSEYDGEWQVSAPAPDEGCLSL